MFKKEIYDYVAKTWEELQSMYQVTCPIIVSEFQSSSSYTFSVHGTVSFKRNRTVIRDIYMEVDDILFSSFLLNNIDTPREKLEGYIYTSLKHEMGHVIDLTTASSRWMFRKDWKKRYKEGKESQEAYRSWLANEWDGSIVKQATKYYQQFAERMANEAVGLSIGDLIKTETEVLDSHIRWRNGEFDFFRCPRSIMVKDSQFDKMMKQFNGKGESV